ncbi:MAG: hypothetical protein KKA54_17470 [Proteobacteria bacterium]|nr:hypothetical protein [Pseudomonadota bacterium]MBU0968157.1 hypothetical protein [Pseudomonadota bacterium]
MDKIVEELHKIFRLKDSTDVGDIVIIVTETPQTLSYSLITGFERDTTRRDEWWHVSMQLLSVPPQKVVWTLRTEQFTGKEIFTMGGEKRYIKAVDFSGPEGRPQKEPKPQEKGKPAVLRVVK